MFKYIGCCFIIIILYLTSSFLAIDNHLDRIEHKLNHVWEKNK